MAAARIAALVLAARSLQALGLLRGNATAPDAQDQRSADGEHGLDGERAQSQGRALGGRRLRFRNGCPAALVVVGPGGGPLGPGETLSVAIASVPKSGARWTPYFAGSAGLCSDGLCAKWHATIPARGSQWLGENARYAAVCNPFTKACCSTSSPGYDHSTGNCPSINTGGWGSLFEASFDSWSGKDFVDFSTNFKNTDRGPVFFNIPMAMTATAGCSNGQAGASLQCLSADCRTAYQSPEDSEHNGAQLACDASASYTVEYCPGGRMPF